MADAIAMIHREHRRLAAVLHCLDHVTLDIRRGRAAPDFALLDLIVDYVESFPDRVHHPKEDKYLFAMLERRAPQLRAVIDQQRAEHARCDEMTAMLRAALAAYRKDPPGAAERFFDAVDAFLAFEREHMSREERLILPRARQMLTEVDHARLKEAFSEHDDPLYGDKPAERFRALFSRIVATAPEPYGLGRASG